MVSSDFLPAQDDSRLALSYIPGAFRGNNNLFPFPCTSQQALGYRMRATGFSNNGQPHHATPCISFLIQKDITPQRVQDLTA